MNNLEKQIVELKKQLTELAERVRLDAVAEMVLKGEHPIREGDFFLVNGTYPTKLANISSDGKWTYFDGHNTTEYFRIPEPHEHDRLYTIAEVAEIVAKAKRSGGRLPGEVPVYGQYPSEHPIFEVPGVITEVGAQVYICRCGAVGDFGELTSDNHLAIKQRQQLTGKVRRVKS